MPARWQAGLRRKPKTGNYNHYYSHEKTHHHFNSTGNFKLWL